jgi:hypothetical protein
MLSRTFEPEDARRCVKLRIYALGLIVGGVLLILGLVFGFYGECFANFATGGESCFVGSFSIPEFLTYVLGWGFTVSGICVMAVAMLTWRKSRAQRLTTPPRRDCDLLP